MATTTIGLDIGSHAVRAVEITAGRGAAALKRVAQVALEPGVVQHGEVVDPEALSAALKRLWREGGFRSRNVVVGVANQRVVVRQADITRMSEEDLRSSLQFQVQELIPIPVDEARLDFRITDSEIPTPSGREDDADYVPEMRILLVAAQRDMVDNLLAGLVGAGLIPTLVDVGPFALLRSLGHADLIPDENAGAEAIVSIGAGVTTIVVHTDGLPQFVRILTSGASDITDGLATEMDVSYDEAEDLKRRATADADDERERQAAAIRDDRTGPLLDDVRSSIDFFLAQSATLGLDRIVVTGGGVRTAGLVDRLSDLMDVPVVVGDPFIGLQRHVKGLTEADLDDHSVLFATAVGYALGGIETDGEHRITLLPTEVVAAQAERRQVLMAIGGVAAFAVLLTGLWVARGAQLDEAQNEADEAEFKVTELRSDIAALSDIEELSQQTADRRQFVERALVYDVAWSRLFQEVATVLPSDAWLTTFNGTTTSDLPTVAFAGQGFDHTSSARWLLRIAELRALTGEWLTSSSKISVAGTDLVNWSSTANLGPEAQSDRLARFGESS